MLEIDSNLIKYRDEIKTNVERLISNYNSPRKPQITQAIFKLNLTSKLERANGMYVSVWDSIIIGQVTINYKSKQTNLDLKLPTDYSLQSNTIIIYHHQLKYDFGRININYNWTEMIEQFGKLKFE